MTLADRVPADPDPDTLFDTFAGWAAEQGLELTLTGPWPLYSFRPRISLGVPVPA